MGQYKTDPSSKAQREIESVTIGQAGEMTIDYLIQPQASGETVLEKYDRTKKIDRKALNKKILDGIRGRKVQINRATLDMIKETTENVEPIINQIIENYGLIESIGRGMLVEGSIVTYGFVDNVVKLKNNNKLMILEVKNTAHPPKKLDILKADLDQARYYNSIVKETGLLQRMYRQNHLTDQLELIPEFKISPNIDTTVIYTRSGKIAHVSDRLEYIQEIREDVWLAKQLGFMGKFPESDCDAQTSTCVHENLPKEIWSKMRIDNSEIKQPIVLGLADGLVENDVRFEPLFYSNLMGTKRYRKLRNNLRSLTRYYSKIEAGTLDLATLNITHPMSYGREMQRIAKSLDFELIKSQIMEIETRAKNAHVEREIWNNFTLKRALPNLYESWNSILPEGFLDKSMSGVNGIINTIYNQGKLAKTLIKNSISKWG